MNATIMTLAKLAAIKAVERELRAQGKRIPQIEVAFINQAATAYLREHPELIAQAAETVRTVPAFRKIAEREERARQRRARATAR